MFARNIFTAKKLSSTITVSSVLTIMMYVHIITDATSKGLYILKSRKEIYKHRRSVR